MATIIINRINCPTWWTPLRPGPYLYSTVTSHGSGQAQASAARAGTSPRTRRPAPRGSGPCGCPGVRGRRATPPRTWPRWASQPPGEIPRRWCGWMVMDGFVGENLNRKPWFLHVFTIKYDIILYYMILYDIILYDRGFRLKFSHHPILWMDEWNEIQEATLKKCAHGILMHTVALNHS